MPRPFTEAERVRIRRLLLEAGRAALAEGGLRRVPVERICAAAGISKGAFYLFFPSKEALVEELLFEAEAQVRATLLARLEEAPADQRLRAVLDVLVQSVRRHPLLRVLADPEEMAWLFRSLPEDRFARARADDVAFFTSLLVRLQHDGLVRPDVDARTFAGLPAALLAVVQQRELVGADRHDAVLELLVEGLIARISASSPPAAPPT